MWALLRCSPRDAAMIVMAITAIGPVFAPLRCGVEPSVIKYTVTWEQWPVWTKGVIEVFG